MIDTNTLAAISAAIMERDRREALSFFAQGGAIMADLQPYLTLPLHTMTYLQGKSIAFPCYIGEAAFSAAAIIDKPAFTIDGRGYFPATLKKI